ncbi:MAG: hypothetical protein WC606_03835 [Candidatus Absconditabacterales bacterium]|jgi:hypothetical protein
MKKIVTKQEIKPLTPKIAIDYLNFKLKEGKKEFLSYRDELVPYYFSAEVFCRMINDFRKTIREYKKEEKEFSEKNNDLNDTEKKEIPFHRALKNIVFSRIKNPNIDTKIVTSLVGVLLNTFKDNKYKEYVKQSENSLIEEIKRNGKEDIFVSILEDLKKTYFFDQDIAEQINSSDNISFFDQAWNIFESQDIKDMPKEEKNKLYGYLCERYKK